MDMVRRACTSEDVEEVLCGRLEKKDCLETCSGEFISVCEHEQPPDIRSWLRTREVSGATHTLREPCWQRQAPSENSLGCGVADKGSGYPLERRHLLPTMAVVLTADGHTPTHFLLNVAYFLLYPATPES